MEKRLKKTLRRHTAVAEKSGKSNAESAGQGEDQEIALAGNYDGKEAAVGGDRQSINPSRVGQPRSHGPRGDGANHHPAAGKVPARDGVPGGQKRGAQTVGKGGADLLAGFHVPERRLAGAPGATFMDVPLDVLLTTLEQSEVEWPQPPDAGVDVAVDVDPYSFL